MRSKYSIIILILIALLVVGGAVLYIAKDNVASYFSNQEDLASLSSPVKVLPSTDALDNSVIQSNTFKSLKNNVNNFDFNNICKRPAVPVVSVIKTVEVLAPNGTVATTTPIENINCQQGNNNPFLVIQKK